MVSSNVLLRRTVLVLTLLFLVGCQSTEQPSSTASSRPTKSERTFEQSPKATTARAKPAAATPATNTPPKVTFGTSHDEEFKAIFELAKNNDWDTAESRAVALSAAAPQDSSVQRLLSWVKKQRQLWRDRAVENKIREIDAQNSVFNPTVPGVLQEKKDRGLPPRKDLRDAVEQIQATPYIPESYGKTIQQKGVMFDLETKEGRMAKILDKEISAHLDNVTLEAVIFNIGQGEGINFVADKALPAFKQTLSMNMDKVRLGEFLRYISRNLEVQFQVGNDLIWIVDGKDPKKALEETRFYRLRKGFVMPAQFGPAEVNRVIVTQGAVTNITENQKLNKFVNDGAPLAPAISAAIKQFFTSTNYMIDFEHNLIVARGTREQLEVMEKIIAELDQPIQQVLIEARFITVSQAAFMQLGASWETGRDLLTSSGRTPTDFTGLGTDVGLGLQESFNNILSRKNLSATLTALEQGGESHTLSAPRLTLINNLPGTISDGKIQYYYEEYQVKQTILERRSSSAFVPAGKPAKVTSGVSLDVLASIGGDGKSILLALNPEVNQDVKLVTFATINDHDDTGKVVSTFDIRLPESRTQSLATRVVVKSGQTVVMGGVLEREQRTFVESIPILGNIPILGAAFRKRTEVDKPRYLLIFVTATLLSESGEFLVYDDSGEKK